MVLVILKRQDKISDSFSILYEVPSLKSLKQKMNLCGKPYYRPDVSHAIR